MTDDPEAGPIPFVIPFLAREASPDWVEALNAALGGPRVRPLGDLTAAERRAARVAVVADPDPADLARLPNLAWVHSLWAGVEALVGPGGLGVPVARMTDPRLAATMAEAVLTWTLWLHRDGPSYASQQAARIWKPRPVSPPEERRVGVLGLGALGRASAARLAAQGFPVSGWSRSAKDVAGVASRTGGTGLDAVLGASDILVVLLPLTPETRGLLDARRLALLPDGARVINFARGAIIDEAALLAALDAGAVGHAVLDVFATEPLPRDHPAWRHPRVTVLPHVSAPTTPATASALVAEAVRAFERDGSLPASIVGARGY